MRHCNATMLIAALTALGGCSGKSSDTAQGEGGQALADGWKTPDACAVLDKAAYGQLIGKPVSASTLSMPHVSDGTTAATSECVYSVDGAGKLSIILRWSPMNDNDEGSINTTRSGLQQTAKAFGGSMEVLAGIGKAAFWVDKTASLNVFVGEDRMAIINVPTGPGAKEQAIAVAHKLGG
jgi:hypothetical protein